MKIEVRYYSRGGNMKKLADAIADAVGVEAHSTDVPLTEDVDILFLGTAVYAGGVDDAVKAFIRGIGVNIGTVVNFSSAALSKSTYKQVHKLLEEKNIPHAEKEFFCKGSFTLLNRGRPNADDCAAAAAFAKEIIKTI